MLLFVGSYEDCITHDIEPYNSLFETVVDSENPYLIQASKEGHWISKKDADEYVKIDKAGIQKYQAIWWENGRDYQGISDSVVVYATSLEAMKLLIDNISNGDPDLILKIITDPVYAKGVGFLVKN